MKKELSLFLRLIFSISIILILFYKIGPKDIIQTFVKVNLLYTPLIILAIIFTVLLGALNLKILIDCINKIKFLKILRYYLLSWAIGLFVPGKMGEFSIVYFLKKEDISIGQSLAISIMDKLITVVTLSFLTIAAFFVIPVKTDVVQFILVLSVIFGIVLFFIVTEIGRGIIKKYVLRKYAEKFAGFSKTFFYYLKDKKDALIINLILTFLKWILSSAAVAILFLAFDTTIRFYYIVLITAATIIVGLVPFTISGLGLRESVAVFFYNLISIKPSVVVSVYLIFNIINYLFAMIIFSAINVKKIKSNINTSLFF